VKRVIQVFVDDGAATEATAAGGATSSVLLESYKASVSTVEKSIPENPGAASAENATRPSATSSLQKVEYAGLKSLEQPPFDGEES
jgi:hypothetical protein